MRYKLVTGFYPSEQTANKIANKARGNCKDVKVEPYEDCYVVILAESNSYNDIDNLFGFYMTKKIYCGIIDDRTRK